MIVCIVQQRSRFVFTALTAICGVDLQLSQCLGRHASRHFTPSNMGLRVYDLIVFGMFALPSLCPSLAERQRHLRSRQPLQSVIVLVNAQHNVSTCAECKIVACVQHNIVYLYAHVFAAMSISNTTQIILYKSSDSVSPVEAAGVLHSHWSKHPSDYRVWPEQWQLPSPDRLSIVLTTFVPQMVAVAAQDHLFCSFFSDTMSGGRKHACAQLSVV